MKNRIEVITVYFLKFLTGIVIVSIFFALYGLIQITVLNKDYANYFGYSLFEVKSGSMSPTINKNDMVIVKRTTDIKKDDIITYKVDTSYVTHRVVDMDKKKIITKGDFNNYEDKTVPKNSLVGKVVKVFPKFGIWKKIILSPVFIITVLLTILSFSLGFSYENKKEKKEKNRKIREIIKKCLSKFKENKKTKAKKEGNKKAKIEKPESKVKKAEIKENKPEIKAKKTVSKAKKPETKNSSKAKKPETKVKATTTKKESKKKPPKTPKKKA